MRRVLLSLRSASDEGFSGAFIEDALWLIFQELTNEGFDHPSVEVLLYDGQRCIFRENFHDQRDILVPKDRVGTAVKFAVKVGPQNYFAKLKIEGVDCLSRRERLQNFYPFFGLYALPSERFYTPKVLENGTRRLQLELVRRGFLDAHLREKTVEHLDNAFGVVLRFDQGKPYQVCRICLEWEGAAPEDPDLLGAIACGGALASPVPATADFLEAQIQRLRGHFFAYGYADAKFSYELDDRVEEADRMLATMRIRVDPGEPLTVGDVIFEGKRLGHFKHLERQTFLRSGDFLNPEQVLADRNRLMKFGICHDIDVSFEETENPRIRNVVHHMQTKKQQEVYLRFGAGNYDIVRFGIDWNQNNLFGLGHQGSFRAIQSFRRSDLRYNYQIPEMFGPDTSLFFHADYLQMEESSFHRHEKMVSLGCERRFPNGAYGSLRYQWEKLTASLDSFRSPAWKNRGNVGALKLVLERNRLNNPLYPMRGDRWKAQLELANKFFGGNSEYERLELEYSHHWSLSETACLHSALRSGTIYSFGDPKRRLPFNKQFFNGGANTIRGFGDGQASSLDEDGNVIGSTSYLLSNLEIEQRILNRLSTFLFGDALAFSDDVHRWPGDTRLLSLGCGISLHTIIGPLRISQAWNLHRRPLDPRHYFRFSIGFPF